MNTYLRLLRPWQWYKNLVIGIALIFSGQFFNTSLYLTIIAGFLALSAISSGNYILNDIKDREEDKKNKEKKNRPLASGKISVANASIIAVVLFVVGLVASFSLGTIFGVLAASLLVLTQIYTFLLKKEAFVDIILIAVNFVIRAVAGAVLISVVISDWLIIGTFFFALFLATGKRTAEVMMLEEKAQKHRENLLSYTPNITRSLLIISTSLLLISYVIYATLEHRASLLFGLPFMLYCVLRYYSFVEEGNKIARHPHLAFKDKRLVIGATLFVVITILLLIT